MELRFSIVITTYNRRGLLRRAVDSALAQNHPEGEIIVVDDASTDGTGELIRTSYPAIRYVRSARNRGVCAARNLGLREAREPWVVFLDDDDTFTEGALNCIAHCVSGFAGAARYPVLQFARSNARTPSEFLVARLDDYLRGSIQGDFAAVIHRGRFLEEGLAFPEFRSGAEMILWWRVAGRYGIPTWALTVQELHSDGGLRMMSSAFQLANARDRAALDEAVLGEFGAELERFPAACMRRRAACAFYCLLAGEPRRARRHVRATLARRMSLPALALLALSYLPMPVIRGSYTQYKRWREGWVS
ncbi:MAG: glycosyltransferase family 2 protein [Acidobacteria bacterium]|nr:glycosyltransferase family 2 protein [Acidobacteriota bacterium]